LYTLYVLIRTSNAINHILKNDDDDDDDRMERLKHIGK